MRHRKSQRGTRSLAADVNALAQTTSRKELVWLKGKRVERDVVRLPTSALYFNIDNGRYADKMIQLRSDHPGVEIDPRDKHWREEIASMLRGEYRGTEPDLQPFESLKADLKAREQLRPGVVLTDGGVLDGNRRVAVLEALAASEPNPSRYAYFEAIVLPPDVGHEDRWRIEAGLQIGRDEKLAYSPINRLLKIREGLQLFGSSPRPAAEIAKTLIGIAEADIEQDIRKISLIDEYLDFLSYPLEYNRVSRLVERFEEAVNILESAKKADYNPHQVSDLKKRVFGIIRTEAMTNWEMRNIWRAIGAPGRGKQKHLKNQSALNELLALPVKARDFQDGSPELDRVRQQYVAKAQRFSERMEASKAASEPRRLVDRVQTNLEQLLETLRDPGVAKGKGSAKLLQPLPERLEEVLKLSRQCLDESKRVAKELAKVAQRG
jgi:hypothetical protein